MRCLVTGASGFIGWYLVKRLAKDGHAVSAWTHTDKDFFSSENVAHIRVDITDPEAVARALNAAAPEVVFHLAAQSLPAWSWTHPTETMRANLDGTLNVLEAVRANRNLRPRVIVAGSSSQYASSPDGSAIREDAPVDPDSPYAISKMAADACGGLYARAFGLDIIRFRPFFWIGPRKEGDVASDIARRVVAIERGIEAKLAMGRTDTVRDMIDVNDGINALLFLLQKAKGGETYNICGGRGVSIGQLLEGFQKISKTHFEIVFDPKLMRPVDERIRVGDSTRIRSLGWAPLIPIEQSIHDILSYWRARPL